MRKLGLAAMTCAIVLGACTQLREPTDAQLGTLLHKERPGLPLPNAPLDSMAVTCLRAWSGNAELTQGLQADVASDKGRTVCRSRLDGWLADTQRNPDTFSFAEVSAPKVVRRAMALQQAREVAVGTRSIPPALLPPAAPATPAPIDSTVDLGVAGTELVEAETLCQKAQLAAADPQANDNLKRYGSFCVGNLSRLRVTMQTAARHGATPDKLAAMAVSAKNMANAARNVLAKGKQ